MTEPDFQIVRTDEGWQVRFADAAGDGGSTVTGVMAVAAEESAARRYVEVIAGVFGLRTVDWGEAAVGDDPGHYLQLVDEVGETRHVFVRTVNERTGVSS